jgi:acetyl esterase
VQVRTTCDVAPDCHSLEPMASLPRLPHRAEQRILKRVCELSPRTQRRLFGTPPTVDGQTLASDTHALIKLAELAESTSFLAGMSVAEARANARSEAKATNARPTILMARVEGLEIPGQGGPIPARLYVPSGLVPGAPLPLTIYFHGGGWVIGDLETHDGVCRLLAASAGTAVLAIDYRLAPEHPFPAGLEDAVAATRWALANVAELGGDREQVIVGGDSAGGNFAAVIAQELRTERLAAQVLIYPGTDVTRRYPSADLFADGYYLDSASMALFEQAYFVDPAMLTDPRVSPMLTPDLRGLAPAVLVTAEFDPIRDQGDAYADVLAAAGNTVLHKQFPGLVHAFLNLGPFVPACAAAVDETIELVRQVLKEA